MGGRGGDKGAEVAGLNVADEAEHADDEAEEDDDKEEHGGLGWDDDGQVEQVDGGEVQNDVRSGLLSLE